MESYTEQMQFSPFCAFITQLSRARGELPEHIIKRANIERSFGHQIFKGTRNPSGDTVLQLAFGFEADTETAQELLKHARMSALYPRVKRDMAILYCLHNRYTVVEAQRVLMELELPLIGSCGVKCGM
jgi:hypothetical protein